MGKNSGNDRRLDIHAAKYCVSHNRLRTLLLGGEEYQVTG